MSLTDGAHVTYSRVSEVFADGSRIDHHYSNHESFPDKACVEMYSNYEGNDVDNPHTSWELSRGLLTRKEYRSALDGHPIVRLEENEYYLDTLQYLRVVKFSGHCGNTLRRKSFMKVFTYHPYLKRTVITAYPDNEAVSHVETVEYTCDSCRRLIETKRMVGDVTERDSYSYTGDFNMAPYVGMKGRNMIALPVESLHFRKESDSDERLIAAELRTWKQSGSHFVPSEIYRAALGEGIPFSINGVPGFSLYNGQEKDSRYGLIPDLSYSQYDEWGNLILSEDHSGLPTTYYWIAEQLRLSAVFVGSKKGTDTPGSSDAGNFFMDFESVYNAPVGFMKGKGHYGVYLIEGFAPEAGKQYVVDWMERQDDGTWEYRSKVLLATDVFSAGTSGKYIDQIRVFPKDTFVESFTWDQFGNLSSRTDSRGVTEYYRYDGLGRLTGIYDNDGKKVEGYKYNYQNR